MEFSIDTIRSQAAACFIEMLHYGELPGEQTASAHGILPLRRGDIVIVGCSTSRVKGKHMGADFALDVARAIMDAVLPICREHGLYLACQCCEHLNRAVVVERECMDKYGFEQVSVKPALHAGGAWSVTACECFDEPVVVEDIRGMARAGVDIGGVFIGMHMHPVVVPVHAENDAIGCAVVSMARMRPKYIGGERAVYR